MSSLSSMQGFKTIPMGNRYSTGALYDSSDNGSTAGSVNGTVSASNLTPFPQFPTECSYNFATGALNWSLGIPPITSSTSRQSMWIDCFAYTRTTNTTARPSLIGQMVIGNAQNWGFGLDNTNRLAFGWWSGSTNFSGFTVTCSPVLSLNQWYHFAVGFDANTGNLQMFIDGVIQTLTLSGNSVVTGSGTTTINIPTNVVFPNWNTTIGGEGTTQITVGRNNQLVNMDALVFNLRFVYGPGSVQFTDTFTVPREPVGAAPTGRTILLLTSFRTTSA